MSKTSNVIAFVVGAAIGSAATWYFLKSKYEQYIQEEVDSIKEAYGEKYGEPKKNVEEKIVVEHIVETKTMQEYAQEIARQRYGSKEFAEAMEDERITYPRVITPDEFTEYDDYYVASLTYFQADNILCDDEGHILDIDETIGLESLQHFGEYEEDCVHVRNNELRTDYEVLLDYRKYSEVFDESK